MALPHAVPGETVRIFPQDSPAVLSRALVLGEQLEVLRMRLAAGDSLPLHRLKDEGTLQCVQGSVRVELGEDILPLQAGELLCLPRHTLYALEAAEDSLLLLTVVRLHAPAGAHGEE